MDIQNINSFKIQNTITIQLKFSEFNADFIMFEASNGNKVSHAER